MFAIIKDNKVIGFITEESQKQFLIENESGVSFAEFNWNIDAQDQSTWIKPDDVVVNEDGTVTVQRNA